MGPFRRLLRLGRRYLPLLALAQGLLVLAALADVGLLALLKKAVDRTLGPGAVGALGGLLALAMGVTAARAVLSYLGTRLATDAETAFVRDLQNAVYTRLHASPLDLFARRSQGDLLARLFHDTGAAANLLTGVTPAAVETPVRFLGVLGYLAWLDPTLAAAVALVVVPAFALSRLVARRLRRGFRTLNEEMARLYDTAHQSLGASELVHLTGAAAREVERFEARNEAVRRHQGVLHHVSALSGPIHHGLRIAGLLAAFAFGAREVAAGRLGPGALAASLVAAYAVLQALEAAAGLYTSAQAGLASAERLFVVLDEPVGLAAPKGGAAPRFTRALRFEGVSFTYPDRTAPALVDVDFTLRPGDHVAVVGPTGSGKTTLLRLALRLVDPTGGAITLDGADLRGLDLVALRRLFAVVPQDVSLFDRSVRENIAYARPAADARDVEEAARRAGVDAIAERLPQGLDTVVGARGALLSGGERQQVGIARAFLRDAPILLLDEATAALDAVTERRVQDALAALARERTTLVVAHRLASLVSAARILVLSEGHLVEQGSHAELAARPGHYRRLLEGQRIA